MGNILGDILVSTGRRRHGPAAMSEQRHIGDEWAAAGSRAVGQRGIDMVDANLCKQAVRTDNRDRGNAYYKSYGDFVQVGEEDVFSTQVKIEVERSKTKSNYVHLRFGYFNRYWRRKEDNDKYIVGRSDQPEEDETNPSCTLFEPVMVDEKNSVFYLRHVQSGGRVSVDGSTNSLYVDDDDVDKDENYLTFVDWNTLVKLPANNVAFKANNGKYLRAPGAVMAFSSDDPNEILSSFRVEQKPDGHVEILQPSYPGMQWRVIDFNAWVLLDNQWNQFWPVKVDENSIALRSSYSNNFCFINSGDGFTDSLQASAATITKEAILQVQESVLERKIYNVMYQMEYARIFDEVPYLAGSATLVNDKDEEASMEVSVTYQDEKSYSFTRSLSLTAGVSASMQAGLPFIEQATITVSYEINGTFQWDTTTTNTTSVTATGTVTVPGKSTVTVDYVGTRGTCSVPYYYTQEDKSSLDGQTVYTDLVDGIYTGVNYYNFNFHVRDTTPL
ncbi:uncharacterized protein LOC125206517 [Salvia hispanica]|uniref:uncharacterized protein LOC125206517 n=1 Tax=Salvia hispanica TaxID=49212 RepID=UPI00200969F3|nr:uncharacterized protein LOC125206517 [Salvia hispanica]